MKAVMISGPNSISLVNIPRDSLAPSDVLVRILATGICGTDVEIVRGTMAYFTSGLASYPVIPGHEWAGEIVELGSEVDTLAVGDRVVGECSIGCMKCARCRLGNYHRCNRRTETGILNRKGGFAEFITFPAAFIHKIATSVPLEVACLVEPAAVAYNGIRLAGVSPGTSVAIFGDGPIGLLLAQMARAFGAQSVVLIGLNSDRLRFAGRLGLSLVVDAGKEDINSALLKYAGELPSVVVEATGNPSAVESAIHATAPGGRLVLQGLFAGQHAHALDLDRVVVGDISIRGALGSPGVWPEVVKLIESARVEPGALLSDVLGLSDFDKGLELVASRRGMKVVLRPDN
jgi:L-iditol 2-dehydrogenase